MKKIALLFCHLFFSSIAAFSQDTLYKRNGDILLTRILEINPENIKYKKFELPDGPIYIIEKSELFMVRYQNGLKEVFLNEKQDAKDDYAKGEIKTTKLKKISFADIADNPIAIDGFRYSIESFNLNPKKVDELLLAKNDKQLSLMIKTAQENKRTSKLLAFAPIPLGVGAYVSLIVGSIAASSTFNQTIPANYLTLTGLLVTAGFGTAIASIVLNSKSKKLRREAVKQYNLNYYGYK
jgi:hypothetical protein